MKHAVISLSLTHGHALSLSLSLSLGGPPLTSRLDFVTDKSMSCDDGVHAVTLLPKQLNELRLWFWRLISSFPPRRSTCDQKDLGEARRWILWFFSAFSRVKKCLSFFFVWSLEIFVRVVVSKEMTAPSSKRIFYRRYHFIVLIASELEPVIRIFFFLWKERFWTKECF